MRSICVGGGTDFQVDVQLDHAVILIVRDQENDLTETQRHGVAEV